VPRTAGVDSVLLSLLPRFDATYVASDPVRFPRRYAAAEDREVAALLSATCAFGNVKAILATLEALFARLGPSPAAAIDALTTRRAAEKATAGLRHRWFGPKEFATCLRVARAARAAHGTLEAAFRAGDEPSAPDVGPGLASFAAFAEKAGDAAPTRATRFMFPSPLSGAACKRMNLFLRWCARPDDGIDLGLWTTPTKARLVVPLDVHVAFHARVLGFTKRTTADWRAALETTAALRRLDASDPVRFDFALCHLGIHGACEKRRVASICVACPLDAVCRLPRRTPKTRRRRLDSGRS
jgi:uncharacterized protein (TIGR02757 family)